MSGLLLRGLLVFFQMRIFSKRFETQNGIVSTSIILTFIVFGIGGTIFINNRVYPIALALFAMMINNLSDNSKNEDINKKLFKNEII